MPIFQRKKIIKSKRQESEKYSKVLSTVMIDWAAFHDDVKDGYGLLRCPSAKKDHFPQKSLKKIDGQWIK